MNCLAYALRFWKENPDYKLYYNSNHVINSVSSITGGGYLPAENYGYGYFVRAFDELLSPQEHALLKEYFNLTPNKMEDQLDKSYKEAVGDAKATGHNFGWAIQALREGQMLRRAGWNGKGMFIVKQIPALIGADVIPKMQSLPQSAKDEMLKREQSIAYSNQLLIVRADGQADSWTASAADIFAEDWEIAVS